MVCTDRIGWRNNSRKLILLFTDRDFHFAMDGKLAGFYTTDHILYTKPNIQKKNSIKVKIFR